jgi:hypothetical protein
MDFGDEITRGCIITKNGELVHEKVREAVGSAAPSVASAARPPVPPATIKRA